MTIIAPTHHAVSSYDHATIDSFICNRLRVKNARVREGYTDALCERWACEAHKYDFDINAFLRSLCNRVL